MFDRINMYTFLLIGTLAVLVSSETRTALQATLNGLRASFAKLWSLPPSSTAHSPRSRASRILVEGNVSPLTSGPRIWIFSSAIAPPASYSTKNYINWIAKSIRAKSSAISMENDSIFRILKHRPRSTSPRTPTGQTDWRRKIEGLISPLNPQERRSIATWPRCFSKSYSIELLISRIGQKSMQSIFPMIPAKAQLEHRREKWRVCLSYSSSLSRTGKSRFQ